MKILTLMGGAIITTLFLSGLVKAETFSLWARSDDSVFMPKLVDAFNAKGKDKVELQIVPVNELVQKYAIAAAGGSAPDALSLDLIYTPSFAQAGQLKDLTAFAKSLPYYDKLSKAHLSVGTYKNKIYGMPFSADASVLVWNKKLFKEAGLDPNIPPKNWAQIRADAKAVSALSAGKYGFYFSGNCGGCGVFTLMPLVWASGGKLFEDNGMKVTVDTPQMRSVVEFYRSMVKDGLVPKSAQTDSGSNFFSAFASGNIGITFLGSFAIGALNSQYPDLDYGVTYLPGKNGHWSSFTGGDNIVVSAGTSKKKMLAIESFIKFAYSPEGQTILSHNGSLPVREDIAKQALHGLDSRYLIPAKAMQKGHTPYSPYFNQLINAQNGPWVNMLNSAIFANSQKDAISAINKAQNQMQSIIDFAN